MAGDLQHHVRALMVRASSPMPVIERGRLCEQTDKTGSLDRLYGRATNDNKKEGLAVLR